MPPIQPNHVTPALANVYMTDEISPCTEVESQMIYLGQNRRHEKPIAGIISSDVAITSPEVRTEVRKFSIEVYVRLS